MQAKGTSPSLGISSMVNRPLYIQSSSKQFSSDSEIDGIEIIESQYQSTFQNASLIASGELEERESFMAFSEASKPEAMRILKQMVTDMEEEVKLERQVVAKHIQEQLRQKVIYERLRA